MSKNPIVQYFIDSFHELGKVTWPTKNRAVNICILVISFILVAAAVIAAVDYFLHAGYIGLLQWASESSL